MARIEGINLPDKKRVEYGLTYVHGIGLFTSKEILNALSISFDKRVKDLTDAEVAMIQKMITDNYVAEGELRKRVRNDINRHIRIGSYRGLRHKNGLPVNGQRTKTNARTRKGPRRAGSAVSLKRKATKK